MWGSSNTLFWEAGLRWGYWGIQREGSRWFGGAALSINISGRKSFFSYLSHSGVGMSQLNHHGEVRGFELKETRENHSLASQSITANTLVTSTTWEAHIYAHIQF